MARSLLVAPAGEDVGLARTCLGLLRALDRAGIKMAFVKPVAQPRPDGGPDRSAALVAAVTTLSPRDPLITAELEGHLGQDRLGKARLDVVLEKIVAAWDPVYTGSDVVVIEGLSSGPSKLYVSAVNQALARSMDAEVLLVGHWPGDGAVEPLAGQLAIAASGYASGEQGRVVGCVVHGLPPAEPGAIEQLTAELARRGLRLLAGVPHRPELTWPRVRDLVRELQPEIVSEGDLT